VCFYQRPQPAGAKFDMVSLLASQAEQVKAVALRIAQKYYGEPQRINARWQRRHGALEAPQQLEGVPLRVSQLKQMI
jgi:hypothetical protein